MKLDFGFLLRAKEFRYLWFAELISGIGSELTRFGIPIWIFATTQSAVAVGVASTAAFLPRVVLGIFSGALVDRCSPKAALIAADSGQAFASALIFLSLIMNWPLWVVYFGLFLSSTFATLDFPALNTATVVLVKRPDLSKANGMVEIPTSLGILFAPLLGGFIYSTLGINGLLLADLISFAIGIFIVMFINFPPSKAAPKAVKFFSTGFLADTFEAFQTIRRTPGLLSTLVITTSVNLFFSISFVLIPPMILTFTGNNARLLGVVVSAGGLGQLLGGALMGLTGGHSNKVVGFLGGSIALGLCGPLIIGLNQNLWAWSIGLFMTSFFLPVITSSSRTIWQLRIPESMIGRAFAFRRTVSSIFAPLGFITAGFLAENVFGDIFGFSKIDGFRACFIFAGIGIFLTGVFGFLSPGLMQIKASEF